VSGHGDSIREWRARKVWDEWWEEEEVFEDEEWDEEEEEERWWEEEGPAKIRKWGETTPDEDDDL